MDFHQKYVSFVTLTCVLFGICSVFHSVHGADVNNDSVSREDFLALQKNFSALWQYVEELSQRVNKLENGDLWECSEYETEELAAISAMKTKTHFKDEDREEDDDDEDDRRKKRPNMEWVEKEFFGLKKDLQRQTMDIHPKGQMSVSTRRRCINRHIEYSTSTLKTGHESKKNITAYCSVRPNKALPPEKRPNVRGKVLLIQENNDKLVVSVKVTGLPHPNNSAVEPSSAHSGHNGTHKHGFHVHEFGNLANGCESSGMHYNPFNISHGSPEAPIKHLGDLGNIESDAHGNVNATLEFTIKQALTGPHSFVGRTLVIHANEDDLGSNSNDHESLLTGNSGERVACCVIYKSD